MKYEAIVFDWDGTLVDSTQRIVESMQCAAQEAQLGYRSAHEIQQIIGLGLPEAIEVLWADVAAGSARNDQMRRLYNEHFLAEVRPAVNFFPYARQLLTGLGQSGFDLAVATGKSRAGLDRAFRELKAGHFFRDSRCADETRSKPHPLMLNELAESLGLAVESMLMIGDTDFDLNMAKNAGMDCVALSHGAHSIEKLSACGPLDIFANLEDFHKWLN